MKHVTYPLLSFTCDFNDLVAFEIEQKGFFDHAVITLEDGTRYKVHFYDPDRLAVDLKTELKIGKACIAEPGLVIVPRVTLSDMQAAAKQLANEGYFDSLKPIVPNA